MASCLVPDFPAVMVALEHLKELDKQLNEGGVPFSHEASLHLTEITAAITELEADRRAAREHLEVETIENSKLRHRINNIRERLSQEIMADAAAARASNAEEMEYLQKELNTVSQIQEATVKRQEALLSQNQVLYSERELVRAEHGEIVAALNDQITIKYGLQMQLDQTREQIEELKSCTAAVAQDKITLQQNMALGREAFTVKQDNLSKEKDQIDREFKQLKQAIRRSRRELDRVNGRKQQTHDHLDELMIHVAKLESNLRTQTASRCQRVEQLEGETLKHQELRQQRDRLKKELCALGEDFSVTVQRLKEETATVEGKVEEEKASGYLCQDSLSQIYEMFKWQHDEENEVRAQHFRVSQQLERSKLQLEGHIASIVKHRSEIRKMDKQITELLEADTINKRVFGRNQEEMHMNVDTEKRNIGHFEEEKKWRMRLLEEAKRKQEEHAVKMTSDINSIRRRYQDLQKEEAVLRQQQPKSTDTDLLMSHMTQCEVEYRGEETRLHQEIVQCTAETESITRSTEEKQREVAEKEERLKEVEARRSEEQSRHQRLELQTSNLRRKRSDLELLIRGLQERIGSLLKPKEKMKAELEGMRERHMEALDKQASELRAAETSVYNSKVKLEQVRLENSRLHLCVRRMTDDLSRAREDKDRYGHESHQVGRDMQALFESLHEAWREDISVTHDCLSSDDALLGPMRATINYLKTRSQQFGNVSTLLHQLMLDFSKQLGYKVTAEKQDVSADLSCPM